MYFFLILIMLLVPLSSQAGVSNPDISAIGQVLSGITDDADSPSPKDPTLSLGEAEIILDANLNPFLKGMFVISGGEEGFGLEEGYASWIKGLPLNLNLKAGKYRLGFGKLNAIHPHSYPFIVLPPSWTSMLPGGEEGFNETAFEASTLFPTPGDWASTFSVDVIEAKSMHPGEDRTSLGWLGRSSNDFLLGEIGAVEAGLSFATGLDDIERNSRMVLSGADLKIKFYLPASSQLILQAEGILNQSHRLDSTRDELLSENRIGYYTYIDYHFLKQFNGGVLYSQTARQGTPDLVDKSVKVFVGYAVMEETTLLRIAYEHSMPEDETAINTLSFQFLFSMGPHKAHKF